MKKTFGVGALLLVLAWLWFVWPTPYLYRNIPAKYGGATTPGRVNRFTGSVDLLDQYGWARVSGQATPLPANASALDSLIAERTPRR